jgi:gamma-butyrobetaine dioxygenase
VQSPRLSPIPNVKESHPSSTSTSFSAEVPILIDGREIQFDSIYLRDSCQCVQCVDPSSSQKNFQTSDIPSDVKGIYEGITTPNGTDESATIRWSNDAPGYSSDHISSIPLSILRRAAAGKKQPHIAHFDPSQRTFWDLATFTASNTFIPYEDFLTSDSTLYHALHRLSTHGLIFLSSVPDCSSEPDSSSSLQSILSRIGPLRNTFYNPTWDVRSVPQATNVAYTHVFLGLHMDLCYTDYTPQFQFLHSLRARAPGGESMFADAFRAAEKIRAEDGVDGEAWRALCEWPVTFHYYNAGESYRQVRRTVELVDPMDLGSAIKNVNWSPPFQGQFEIGAVGKDREGLRAFLKAANRFEKLVSDEVNVFEYRMREGDCMIFDNRRVLHARRAFDVSKGERWLKGAYLDRDVMASRLARLAEKHGTE